jgi:polyisoprenoid-binding protein YceI
MSISTETRQVVSTGTWQLDPVHSSVGFEVNYMVGAFRGQFREVAAELVAGEQSITLSGTAQVASVDVKDENLAAHLQSPDFFDAERHPELSFTATRVEPGEAGVTFHGELTIKGITQPVELHGAVTDVVADPYGRDRIGLTLSTTVDRTDFGLNWNTPLPNGEPALSNDVRLVAELSFVREA